MLRDRSWDVRAYASNSVATSYGSVISFTTAPTISLTPTSLPAATVGQFYNRTIAATGGIAPYTSNVVGGTTVPPGLVITQAGVLNGTPSTSGTYNFRLQPMGVNGYTGTQAYTFTVNQAATTTALAPRPTRPPSGRL